MAIGTYIEGYPFHIQADGAIRADVGVVDACGELELRGLLRSRTGQWREGKSKGHRTGVSNVRVNNVTVTSLCMSARRGEPHLAQGPHKAHAVLHLPRA